MAPRLKQGERTSAQVVQLKPRKAKGAGGAKRSNKPVGRMKPKAHEEKPQRQSRARQAAEAALNAAAKPTPAAAAAPAPAQPRQMTDAELRRSVQDRLVALHASHRAIDNRLAIAEAAADVIRDEKKATRGQIQTLVPLSAYDEAYKKLKQKTTRSDNEAYERARALVFDALGLPSGPQPELNLEGVPEALKPGAYWEEAGYHASINGEFADPARDHVPPENTQDYMRGFTRGTERNAAGLKALKADPADVELELKPPSIPGAEAREGVAGEPKVTGLEQPDWSAFPLDLDAWSSDQWATFRAWYRTVPQDQDVDIEHPAVEQAFDQLAEEEAARAPVPSEFD